VKGEAVKQPTWLLLPVVFCVGCSKEQVVEKPLTPVRVQMVETEKSEQGPKYSGSIEPVSRVDVAFRLGGYVEQILTVSNEGGGTRLVHEGDVVEKGTTLVTLRDADYKAKIAQAQSQLDQAKAALVQTEEGVKQARVGVVKAQQDYDRADALFKKQSLTKSDMDGAKAQLDNAQAVLGGAEAQLPLARARIAGGQALVDEANLALKDSALVAPSRGVVIKRLVEVGSLVGPGSPAYVLADLNNLKAVFGAPDVLLPHLKIGMPLALSTDSAPGGFTGKITSIASAADPRSRVFDVEVTFPNKNLRLKPGMIVSIQMAASQPMTSTPVIPLSAIVRSKSGQEGYSVFVVEEQGGKATAHVREVKLGGALNDSIIVNEGVRPGERIIVTGATVVNDGEVVKIVP
jgi:RND family efflux transporter MFP subunit